MRTERPWYFGFAKTRKTREAGAHHYGIQQVAVAARGVRARGAVRRRHGGGDGGATWATAPLPEVLLLDVGELRQPCRVVAARATSPAPRAAKIGRAHV